MKETEILKYQKLNELAQTGGIVILGGSEDLNIPLCEIRQAFEMEENLYNRSFMDFSVTDSVVAYDACVSALKPETILLHVGQMDLDMLQQKAAEFDSQYRALINHIRAQNKHCRIAIVSLRNYENDPVIANMNTHLKYIADMEHCEFGDIACRRVWNPKATLDAANFVRNIGFMRPLKIERSILDLTKMLFCTGACA